MRSMGTGAERTVPRTVAGRSRGRGLGWYSPGQVTICAVILLVATLVSAQSDSSYWVQIFQVVNLYTAVAVFVHILYAEAGQISFGHGAVFGASAYTVGLACGVHELPFLIGVVLAVGVASLIGVIFALPAYRLEGFYLGFVTLAFALVLPQMLLNMDSFTHGVVGISYFAPDLQSSVVANVSILSILTLLVAVGSIAFHHVLRRSALGRRMRVVAGNKAGAETLGINTGLTRSLAFVISAAGTGLAGALYVPTVGYISPGSLPLNLSLLFFLAVLVGGKGWVAAPLAGIAVMYIVPDVLLVDLLDYRLLTYGLIALALMVFMPDGLLGSGAKLVRRLFRRGDLSSIPIGDLVRPMVQGLSASPPLESAGVEPVVVQGIEKRYGSMYALRDVSLIVERGTIHGLVGPNGSGKTTLLNVVTGLVRPDQGSVRILGTEIRRLPTHRIAGLGGGVGRSFQVPSIYDDLTIGENLSVAAETHARGRSVGKGVSGAWLDDRSRDQLPVNLPHGQRRYLEVARLVAGGAELLLLDEPASGLSPEERIEFANLLLALKQAGHTVLLVEHDLNLVRRLSDSITVLDAGDVVASGPTEEVLRLERVQSLFLG